MAELPAGSSCPCKDLKGSDFSMGLQTAGETSCQMTPSPVTVSAESQGPGMSEPSRPQANEG